jgi:hypothetical protein
MNENQPQIKPKATTNWRNAVSFLCVSYVLVAIPVLFSPGFTLPIFSHWLGQRLAIAVIIWSAFGAFLLARMQSRLARFIVSFLFGLPICTFYLWVPAAAMFVMGICPK